MLDHFYYVCIVDKTKEAIIVGDSNDVSTFVNPNDCAYVFGRVAKNEIDYLDKLEQCVKEAVEHWGFSRIIRLSKN